MKNSLFLLPFNFLKTVKKRAERKKSDLADLLTVVALIKRSFFGLLHFDNELILMSTVRLRYHADKKILKAWEKLKKTDGESRDAIDEFISEVIKKGSSVL